MITLFFSLPTSVEQGACLLGALLFVACIVAGIDAFMTYYHMIRMSEPDEFQDLDDQFAVSIQRWNNIDGVRTIMFQDVETMHKWIVANIRSEHTKVQLYLQAIIAHEKTGIFRFTVELSSKEDAFYAKGERAGAL